MFISRGAFNSTEKEVITAGVRYARAKNGSALWNFGVGG